MASKKTDNLIHVRFDYEEAVESRRDVLFSQLVALRMEKAINIYKIHRIKELELKEKLYKKMKDLRSTITKLEKSLPKLEIPEIVEKKKSGERYELNSDEKTNTNKEDIEGQLKEIQNRLDRLQRDSMGI